MNPNAQPTDGLVLNGLDGSNPLAFLAALGTLHALTYPSAPPRAPSWTRDIALSWKPIGAYWTPTLHFRRNTPPQPEELITTLFRLLRLRSRFFLSAIEAWENAANRKQLALDYVRSADPQKRNLTTDWISSFYSDLAPDATCQLQTVRRDNLFGNLRKIIRQTTARHLHRTLFVPWNYSDALSNQSLHLDPSEDRRYAYQWHRPSGDPTRSKRGGMLGANRLAIEAAPFFQSFPAGDKLQTRGFSGLRIHNTRWTWPIWSPPLMCDEIASLLGWSELQAEAPNEKMLKEAGVAIAYRCRRILVEKTPNFTPAVALL